jgi:reactive chlorine resistance protein C
MSTLAAPAASPSRPTFAPERLEALGAAVARGGVVTVLLAIGALKFTAGEAQGIRGLIETSPLLSWMYAIFSVQGASNFIGGVEIVAALGIAAGARAPRFALAGSALAVVTFLTTLSFMLTAPGVWDKALGFPALGGSGQFLVKDVALLGASLLAFGNAWAALAARRHG